MDCALWLNRRKVFSASEISDNLDTASLLGYFVAGSLVEWLYEHGGEEYAKKLEKLSPADSDIRGKIEAVFKGKPTAYRTLGSENTVKCAAGGISYCSYRPSSVPSSMRGSFRFGSGSFLLGSFLRSFRTSSGSFYNYIGSFYLGSFLFGSGFHEWEWEWEWEKFFGSFFNTSFRFGSGIAAKLAFLRNFGSYRFGSYNFGSFGGTGSFDAGNLPELPEFLQNLDEYDRIMLMSLYGCPLNQFGYGIHNI